MALNLDRCVAAQTELDSRKGKGDLTFTFMNQKDLTEETTVRILPPAPELDGLWYMTVCSWWLNKKPVVVGDTFGGQDFVEDEFKRILDWEMSKGPGMGDKDVIAAVEAALRSTTEKIFGSNVSKDKENWIPILALKYVAGKFTVEDDRARILKLGSTLTSNVNKLVTSRVYQNGTPDGMMDRVRGFNLILSKTGVKKETRYSAMGAEQWEAPAQFYLDIPNPYRIAQALMPSEDYQRALVREYVYGMAIPEPLETAEKKRREILKEEHKTRRAAILAAHGIVETPASQPGNGYPGAGYPGATGSAPYPAAGSTPVNGPVGGYPATNGNGHAAPGTPSVAAPLPVQPPAANAPAPGGAPYPGFPGGQVVSQYPLPEGGLPPVVIAQPVPGQAPVYQQQPPFPTEPLAHLNPNPAYGAPAPSYEAPAPFNTAPPVQQQATPPAPIQPPAAPVAPIPTPQSAAPADQFDTMNMAQLRAFSKEHKLGVKPPRGSSEADIRALVRNAMATLTPADGNDWDDF